MARVTLERVRKVYSDSGFVAVHDLDLDVADGEFVVLVGPSGCGKSTTLRMIAGLESITSGRLSIGGRLVNALPPKERDVAMVFQGYALYPHMTVFENMAFALRLRKRPREEIAARVGRAAQLLALTDVLGRRPRQLSGGQRQRVAIGRAIVREPQVFLFDEPLSNLDAQLRSEMRREIAALHRSLRATTIYVTHDQVEAMSLADRIAVMDEGVLQQVGTPMDVYQHPKNLFVAQFIGSPVMNVMPGRLQPDGGRMKLFLADADEGFEFAGPVPRQSINTADGLMIGVRPEAVQLALTEQAGYIPIEAHLVEPLGAYDLVDLKLGSQFLRARTSSGFVAGPEQTVWAHIEESHTHFFSSQSGIALEVLG
jgi:multiple sugar transport system ATP-binding protein